MNANAYAPRNNIRKTSLFLIITIALSFFSIILGSFSVAKAAQVNDPTQQEINQVADILKTTDESIIYDQDGIIMGINTSKLAAKYGNQSEFEQMNQILNNEYQQRKTLSQSQFFDRSTRSTNSFISCMKSQLIGYVGGDIFAALLAGGIQGLLQRKAWYDAAKLILRYAKLGAPQLVAAQIAFMALQCS